MTGPEEDPAMRLAPLCRECGCVLPDDWEGSLCDECMWGIVDEDDEEDE